MHSVYMLALYKVSASSMISPIILGSSHTLLILLMVTNWSMRVGCLESQFGLHIDTHYCAHENFTKYLNISLCLSYMRHMFILKFNDIMPLIRSCWWLQIGL
jgi:hypothetical protein